ncbi:MAG: glycoside hydrolase family 2 TIM barrel-domain containing protein [Sulfolobales archaeon]
MRSNTRPMIDLNGFWRFCIDPNDSGISRGWNNGLPSECKDLVYVPASYNEQNPNWDEYFGSVWYERTFYVPQRYNSLKAWLVLEGAGPSADIWINGTYVGENLSLFSKANFDITDRISFDDINKVVIRILNKLDVYSIPPSVSARFYYPYGGIIRPIYIEFTDPSYISAVRVTTDHERSLQVEVDAICVREPCYSRILLMDKFSGNVLYENRVMVSRNSSVLRDRVSGVMLWEPEDPNLYILEVNLEISGDVVDSVYDRIGFRDVKISGGRILLNGKPIFLKGFGRHEDFPIFGRSLPGPVLVRDFYLMKKVGANSFRTSHYPYSKDHLDLADEFGFLVILEMPLIALSQEHYTEEYLEKVKRVVKAVIDTHRNRPSVIMYSLVNEPSYVGEEALRFFNEVKNFIKHLDPSRPITHACHRHLEDRILDIDDVISLNIYSGWYTIPGDVEAGVKNAVEIVNKIHERYPDKPIIITEFGAEGLRGLHSDPPIMWSEEYQAMFLKRYIEQLAKLPYIQGLHIWNFADFRQCPSNLAEVIRRPGEHNYKGVFTRDRQPKIAARVVQELFTRLGS